MVAHVESLSETGARCAAWRVFCRSARCPPCRGEDWVMDLGHLNAEMDRLAEAIEQAGGSVTERDLNYVEDSAELFYERDGERYEVHLKRLPDRLRG